MNNRHHQRVKAFIALSFLLLSCFYFFRTENKRGAELQIIKRGRFLASEGETKMDANSSALQNRQSYREALPKPLPAESLTEIRKAFATFLTCSQEAQCPGDESDSRSAEFRAVSILRDQLQKWKDVIILKHWQSPEITQLARELLQVDDGAIKEQALDLLSTQPTEVENISAIAEGVFAYHDGNLVTKAVSEFQKQLEGDSAFLIHQAIQQSLLTGSLLVRERLSTHFGKFINSGSYEFYSQVSEDRRIDLEVRRKLKSSLNEFYLAQTGG